MKKPKDAQLFNTILKDESFKEIIIEIEEKDDFGRSFERKNLDLTNVLGQYFSWSNRELVSIEETVRSYKYPESNAWDILEELPSSRYINQKYYPSIAKYLELVKYAGYAKETSE
jgi:hypothetical protein